MKTSKIFAVLFCTIALTANAQIIKEVSGFQNPESVSARKDKLYVTNMGAVLDPLAKDGDGYISMLSRNDGKIVEEKFIGGLNSPKGLLIRHKKLWVTDVDRVYLYNIKTKKMIRSIDLSPHGISYTNDLTKRPGGAYVSVTLKNGIYKVCKKGKAKQLKTKAELAGPNGVFRKARKLFVANYGRDNEPNGSFGKMKRNGKKYKVYQSGGIYDGIIKIGHRLVVTDWVSQTENKGRIVSYHLCKKKATEISLGRTLDGPADLYADKRNRQIWIPVMRENKIVAISFDSIKK